MALRTAQKHTHAHKKPTENKQLVHSPFNFRRNHMEIISLPASVMHWKSISLIFKFMWNHFTLYYKHSLWQQIFNTFFFSTYVINLLFCAIKKEVSGFRKRDTHWGIKLQLGLWWELHFPACVKNGASDYSHALTGFLMQPRLCDLVVCLLSLDVSGWSDRVSRIRQISGWRLVLCHWKSLSSTRTCRKRNAQRESLRKSCWCHYGGG